MPSVLICGATGRVGGEAARILALEAAIEVRCLVRDASSAAAVALKELGCTLCEGAFERQETLCAALDGVAAAFLACSNQPQQVELETQLICAAEASATCTYLIKLGTVDVGEYSSASSPVEYGRFHAAIEARLAASSLTWTTIHPNCFMQNHAGDIFGSLPRRLVAYPHSDAKAALVDTRDVGAVVAKLLSIALREEGAHDAHAGRRYHVCGPCGWSAAGLAQLYSRVLGTPIKQEVVGASAFRQSLEVGAKMEPWYANAVTHSQTDFWATGMLDYPSSPEVCELLLSFRTMEQWVEEMAPLVTFLP